MADKNIHAVIQLGSKQFLIKVGDKIIAEKTVVPEDKVLKVSEVLLTHDGTKTQIGTPFLDKVTIELAYEGDKKAEKIRVAKFKAKSRYRRVNGHRQTESHFTVKSIDLK